MIAYIIRRLMLLPITVVGVTILIFGMLQLLSPVERSALYVRDIPHTEGALDATIRRYGLNDPFVVQYWRWLVGRADPVTGETVGGVLRGDLGYSRTGNQDVIDLLLHRLPATVELALWSIVPIIGVGIWLGVLAAVNHNKLIDQVARIFSIVGYSFPSFVFGLLVLLIFYARLEWFPPGRLTDWASQIVQSASFTRYTQLNTVDALLNGRLDIFADALRHMVLPVLTLSYIQWALLLKITRSAMLEALRQDYVTTARAKGLAQRDRVKPPPPPRPAGGAGGRRPPPRPRAGAGPGRDVTTPPPRPNALIPVATVSGLTLV